MKTKVTITDKVFWLLSTYGKFKTEDWDINVKKDFCTSIYYGRPLEKLPSSKDIEEQIPKYILDMAEKVSLGIVISKMVWEDEKKGGYPQKVWLKHVTNGSIVSFSSGDNIEVKKPMPAPNIKRGPIEITLNF